MAIPYYRFFPGDYARDTRHLSLMQHGAYRLLIDLYMDVGGPLRNDLNYLHRWLHAESVEEKQSVEFILSEFFILQTTGWIHTRCDREISWRIEQSAAGKKAVEAREIKRKSIEDHSLIDRSSNQNQNQNQNQNYIKPKTLATRSASASPVRLGEGQVIETIPLVGNAVAEICETHVKELDRLFPAVDVPQTLREIRAWNLSNSERRKTSKGIAKHITNWMQKVQNG